MNANIEARLLGISGLMGVRNHVMDAVITVRMLLGRQATRVCCLLGAFSSDAGSGGGMITHETNPSDEHQ